MAKYKAVAATSMKVFENWGTSEFTDKALSVLAETSEGKPVFRDFNNGVRIGVVVSATIKDGRLIIVVNMDDSCAIHKNDRIVPGFIVSEDCWEEIDGKIVHRKIECVESVNYGLTKHPVERELPEIELLKEG